MKTNIIVKLQVEGVHSWLDCPIEEVSFLTYPHRHIFHITAKKAVTHNDRDIEIIQLKRNIQQYLWQQYPSKFNAVCEFNSLSCESIAEDLLKQFELNYCSVLEDNENGAEILAGENNNVK